MGAVRVEILTYLVWIGTDAKGGYASNGKGRRSIVVDHHDEATRFEQRTDAETFILLDSGKYPDRIGQYEIRAIVAGYAIRYSKTVSEPVQSWGQEVYTMNQTKVMYVGAGNSIVGSLDEAAKFSSREKAEEISFNMALKDKSLLGAVEVVEIQHIQRA